MRLATELLLASFAVFVVGVLIARHSASTRKDESAAVAPTASLSVTSQPVPVQKVPAAIHVDTSKASVPEPRVVTGLGRPASLAEYPNTPELRQGLEALRNTGGFPPGDGIVEAAMDYRLRFQSRLEACIGTFPSTGQIMFHILFQPEFGPDGVIHHLGSANRVTVDLSQTGGGLSQEEVDALARCGAQAAKGLPDDSKYFTKDEPEFHVFLFMKFPQTEDSFPYNVLRTGKL